MGLLGAIMTQGKGKKGLQIESSGITFLHIDQTALRTSHFRRTQDEKSSPQKKAPRGAAIRKERRKKRKGESQGQ